METRQSARGPFVQTKEPAKLTD